MLMWIFSLENSCRFWRDDIDFITNVENSNQFARHSDVIFEDFQEFEMIQILIWDCQYWEFCRKID